jgi:hypothetical protein
MFLCAIATKEPESNDSGSFGLAYCLLVVFFGWHLLVTEHVQFIERIFLYLFKSMPPIKDLLRIISSFVTLI